MVLFFLIVEKRSEIFDGMMRKCSMVAKKPRKKIVICDSAINGMALSIPC